MPVASCQDHSMAYFWGGLGLFYSTTYSFLTCYVRTLFVVSFFGLINFAAPLSYDSSPFFFISRTSSTSKAKTGLSSVGRKSVCPLRPKRANRTGRGSVERRCSASCPNVASAALKNRPRKAPGKFSRFVGMRRRKSRLRCRTSCRIGWASRSGSRWRRAGTPGYPDRTEPGRVLISVTSQNLAVRSFVDQLTFFEGENLGYISFYSLSFVNWCLFALFPLFIHVT